MSSDLKGDISIKIEFDDDDFKLLSAKFSPDGKFRCEHGLTLKQNNFKALAIKDSKLIKLMCNIEGEQDGELFGSYSLIQEHSI